MQSFGLDSAVELAVMWAAHVMGECAVHAAGCNFTDFLFNGMLPNYLCMWWKTEVYQPFATLPMG